MTTAFLSEVENGHKAASIVSFHRLAAGLGLTAAALISEWEKNCGRPAKE